MSIDVDLAQQLGTRCGGEQALRRLLDDPEPAGNARLWAKIDEVDADNTAWLGGVLDRHGWPGFALVGPGGAADARLLAQHAELGFQLRASTCYGPRWTPATPTRPTWPTSRTAC